MDGTLDAMRRVPTWGGKRRLPADVVLLVPAAGLAARARFVAVVALGVAAVRHLLDVAGLVVDRGTGHITEALLHQPPHLELNGALLGDGDGLERLGVLCLAR